MIYFNEIDAYPAQWMRNLIDAGELAAGVVDERSIIDVQPDDVTGYDRCHFFAGIGLWELALQWAGWPTGIHAWTGSCPCQPFSCCGKRRKTEDRRHLWPELFRLISARRPEFVFGEQVSGTDGVAWLDAVSADLESVDYGVGSLDLCAAGVGSPQRRQRLYWVAYSVRDGWGSRRRAARGKEIPGRKHGTHDQRCGGYGAQAIGKPAFTGSQGYCGGGDASGRHNATAGGAGFWDRCEWIEFADGWRPVEPGTFPLAPRNPAHVCLLRAYGNAIIPELAAEFVATVMDEFGIAPVLGVTEQKGE